MRALTRVCIGSDFDGIINPVWCCPTVEDLAVFKKAFTDSFEDFARSNDERIKLPPALNVSTLADQIFYENGKDFVMSRLKVI